MGIQKLSSVSIRRLPLGKEDPTILENSVTIFVKIAGEEVTTFANRITTITKDEVPLVGGVGNIS